MGIAQRPDNHTMQASRAGLLLRRLMITCPGAGRAADTGFEITALPGVTDARHVLIDCLECGQDHEWTVDDFYAEEPAVADSSAGSWPDYGSRSSTAR